MIYLFGIAGFILGFIGGLFVIALFLKGYSAKQLTRDKSLRWTYGLAVWLFGALGAGAGVWVYERSFF